MCHRNTEWAAPAHSSVKKGGGEKATAFGGGGGKGGKIKGVQRLWAIP